MKAESNHIRIIGAVPRRVKNPRATRKAFASAHREVVAIRKAVSERRRLKGD